MKRSAAAVAWQPAPAPRIPSPLPAIPEKPRVPAALSSIRSAVSYRRHLLDAHLNWSAPLMRGDVIDLGGKRERKRGAFRPPVEAVTSWTYVNLDPDTAPDLLCDVSAVPLKDACANCVICTEVLQHVESPAACVDEAWRLLRRGGVLIASTPFVTPPVGDPYDYRRFTPDGLRQLLADFDDVQILAMGGYLGSLGTLVEFGAREIAAGRVAATALQRTCFETGRMLQWLDVRRDGASSRTGSGFTTGYFVIARK